MSFNLIGTLFVNLYFCTRFTQSLIFWSIISLHKSVLNSVNVDNLSKARFEYLKLKVE